jgi:nucleoside-diphosphate-sugar epimerase
MKVLVLGGTGYVGSHLCAMLQGSGWATPVSASARRQAVGFESLRVDSRDPAALRAAMRGVDAVVNCVAGDAASIAGGAKALAQAALQEGCPRVVHLSSMSVYGAAEGRIDEMAPLDPTLGWYGRAKCEAERHVAALWQAGGTAVILRPGCVWGPGSQLWVGRIARWLRAGRLGDLGIAGDGWSNGVHVDDVCHAVMASLRVTEPGLQIYNLAAPDSPRWNDYFVDLALAIGAVPVRRIASRQLQLDAWLAGPPLKAAQLLLTRLGLGGHGVPDALPPGLLGLWERHLLLDASAATQGLGLQWTPYAASLRQSASWFLRGQVDGAIRRTDEAQSDKHPTQV